VPALQEARVSVAFAPVRATAGFAEFGAPNLETASIKQGRLGELLQFLADGAIGRRFQGLRFTGIQTVEGEIASAKLFVAFEAFGDNSAAPAGGVGVDIALFAGETPLARLFSTSVFLPYANFWYPNSYVFALPLEEFDRADRLEFIARPEVVRIIEAA
jgi:hypothetical protein